MNYSWLKVKRCPFSRIYRASWNVMLSPGAECIAEGCPWVARGDDRDPPCGPSSVPLVYNDNN